MIKVIRKASKEVDIMVATVNINNMINFQSNQDMEIKNNFINCNKEENKMKISKKVVRILIIIKKMNYYMNMKTMKMKNMLKETNSTLKIGVNIEVIRIIIIMIIMNKIQEIIITIIMAIKKTIIREIINSLSIRKKITTIIIMEKIMTTIQKKMTIIAINIKISKNTKLAEILKKFIIIILFFIHNKI